MLTQILAGAFLLGFCIFFHELGHFLIGKLMGIRAKIFSIGYGRGILFKKRKHTIFQITAIPLGGYVQFYGDDPTKEYSEKKPGDFFSASPWRRIATAIGGPGFSILLGFLVIFALITLGWQPTTNKIKLIESTVTTPAASAGLKNGDRIMAVNGNETTSFEEIYFQIGLASDPEMELTVSRNREIIKLPVTARNNADGGQYEIGIKPEGDSFLIVKEGKTFKNFALMPEDRILEVENKKISNIEELRASLRELAGKSVSLKIDRKNSGWIRQGKATVINISLPVQATESLILKNITDTQTEKSIPDIEVNSIDKKLFSRIFIDSRSFSEWKPFKEAFLKKAKAKKRIKINIGAIEIISDFSFEPKGLLGIKLYEGLENEKADLPKDFFSIIKRTYNQTIFTTQTTILGLYRLIQGKLSFTKSVSGPVKILAIAAKSVSYGWDYYFFLLAQITIILGIMNLLPIPVLDGGHVIFYLIEGIYKPIPPQKIAIALRISMMILISFGIYVIGQDIWDVFIKGMF